MHDARESGNPPRPNPANRYSLEDTMLDLEPARVRRIDGDDYTYDLRTLPQREAADVAALAQRCDSQQEQINVLVRQMEADRRERAAMREALERQGSWMQERELRGDNGR